MLSGMSSFPPNTLHTPGTQYPPVNAYKLNLIPNQIEISLGFLSLQIQHFFKPSWIWFRILVLQNLNNYFPDKTGFSLETDTEYNKCTMDEL